VQNDDEQVSAVHSADAAEPAARSSVPPLTRDGAEPKSWEGKLIRWLLQASGNPRVAMVLWNGDRVWTCQETPVVTLHLADRGTLLRACADPHMEFGDGYSEGRIRVEGDLEQFIEDVYRGDGAHNKALTLLRNFIHWLQRGDSNTLDSSKQNIHHHYDIGNEFYALWLGSTMAYTCAYFPTQETGLDDAQIAKMDHVCRKLRLRAGERVVEAGCGWGSLALHMARHYGVRVRAFNISREQILFARERARLERLEGQVEFVEDDYRNISGSYDAFVSVGMLEHVGVANYPRLGRVINGCLQRNGRGLIHTIGRNRPKPMHPWIDRRIFPGAEPPSLRQMMDIFEEHTFSVLDVENLRLHYARTLDHWWRQFEAQSGRIAAMFDERFVRMWRVYLLGSKATFGVGELQLFQVLFAPGRNNEVAWSRDHLYHSCQ
jgi:cyclopropane-fatty-acyl-phospholipid synthase